MFDTIIGVVGAPFASTQASVLATMPDAQAVVFSTCVRIIDVFARTTTDTTKIPEAAGISCAVNFVEVLFFTAFGAVATRVSSVLTYVGRSPCTVHIIPVAVGAGIQVILMISPPVVPVVRLTSAPGAPLQAMTALVEYLTISIRFFSFWSGGPAPSSLSKFVRAADV